MNQLTQQLKNGRMEILEVPFPMLNKGQVLIRNHYSVISAGTEGKTVTDARKGYIAKAKSRKKEVRQVIEMIKVNGFLSTYKTVMNKLESPVPLGYSSAGEVIAVGEGVTEFKAGDYVACGGGTASHADVVSVPVNLCCKVPKEVNLDEAAFTTIASIAIQGIRQADLRTGENCLIIGCGLVGLLTAQILEASGIMPVCIDISQRQVDFAKKTGLKYVFNRKKTGIQQHIMELTDGNGADAIIITAGTTSLDPVEFAGEIARQKAKVVIVGAVPTGFSRQQYYRKELDLRMSTSYGPGRYDTNYEEKGIDYPIGYVRFTEKRNMQTYIRLLTDKKLNINALISHRFKLENAPNAYSMIVDKAETFAGILIEYDKGVDLQTNVSWTHKKIKPADSNVGLIGAGNFAQNVLLPKMKGLCNFVGIASMHGQDSINLGRKYGFSEAFSDPYLLISDNRINTLFVLTRHNSHAEYIIKGILSGKHIFTEKPMAMNEKELESIRAVYEKSERKHLMVGFNRRFSPAIQKVKQLFLDEQPKSITIRINAGIVPPDHWVNDPEIGGGRIVGETCHFIDLAMYLAGSKFKTISASAMADSNNLNNSVTINLTFNNGSIASVNYFSNGNKNLPKEYIEVFCGGSVAIINDFKKLHIYDKSIKTIRLKGHDKGHANEVLQYLNSIRDGNSCPISFEEGYLSTLATFKVLESIQSSRTIHMESFN